MIRLILVSENEYSYRKEYGHEGDRYEVPIADREYLQGQRVNLIVEGDRVVIRDYVPHRKRGNGMVYHNAEPGDPLVVISEGLMIIHDGAFTIRADMIFAIERGAPKE